MKAFVIDIDGFVINFSDNKMLSALIQDDGRHLHVVLQQNGNSTSATAVMGEGEVKDTFPTRDLFEIVYRAKELKMLVDEWHCGFHIQFENGRFLSCQVSEGSYSDGGETTCEIAVFNSEHNFVRLGVNDDVLGWVTAPQFEKIIMAVAYEEHPTQMVNLIRAAVSGVGEQSSIISPYGLFDQH